MDALAALCGFVSREWGCCGYAPVSMVSGVRVLYLEVGCSDGSRFWVGTDRDAVHLVSGGSLEECAHELRLARERELAEADSLRVWLVGG